jgi:hypothetical protein
MRDSIVVVASALTEYRGYRGTGLVELVAERYASNVSLSHYRPVGEAPIIEEPPGHIGRCTRAFSCHIV